jgi:hypothetical protein
MSWLLLPAAAPPGDAVRADPAIFDLDDEAEVSALVAADPAVVSGIMTPEIRPLRLSVR